MWVKDMESIQDREIPHFARWRADRLAGASAPVPKLKAAAKRKFLEQTVEDNWRLTLVANCHQRALLTAKKVQPIVSRPRPTRRSRKR